jgi:RND family efflux transporter MFP subunit
MNDTTLTPTIAAPTNTAEHDHVDVRHVRALPSRVVIAIAIASLCLFGGLFVLGWLPHARRLRAAVDRAAAAVAEKTVVDVVSPRRAPRAIDLTLPGDVRADRATSIHARTSGYLKTLPPGIDIGARVTAGQTLAEISAPELDADLARARAATEQANATVQRATDDVAFQQASFKRYQGFAAEGGLTEQQLDERRQQLQNATSTLRSAEANAAAAAAAQKRLEELAAFEHVTAPFDGVLTYRGYDVGAMIAAEDVAAARELFRIVATDVVRVRVAVPQMHADAVQVGQQADLLLRDRPGSTFAGKVARTARAIDPTTRTLQIEVDVPNADGAILPGTYGQVRLHIERENPGWVLPTSTLMFGAEGLRIAVVTDGRIRMQPVAIDLDYGNEFALARGVDAGTTVVTNPGERLADGLEVTVRRAAAGKVEPRR